MTKKQISARFVTGTLVPFGRYPRGGKWPVLLVRVDDADEGDETVVSINFPEPPLTDKEVAVKDYSECEGVLRELMRVGVVAPPHRTIPSGYVDVPVCNLL